MGLKNNILLNVKKKTSIENLFLDLEKRALYRELMYLKCDTHPGPRIFGNKACARLIKAESSHPNKRNSKDFKKVKLYLGHILNEHN